jgi:hypothetical protein
MDNFKPADTISQSPHVTLWGLCASIYELWYLICVLWLVRILNSSTLSEVRVSKSSTLSEVRVSNSSTLSEVRILNLSAYIE